MEAPCVNFSVQLPDKSYLSFDARKVPAFREMIERTSAVRRKRLETLEACIHGNFKSRDGVLVALISIATLH